MNSEKKIQTPYISKTADEASHKANPGDDQKTDIAQKSLTFMTTEVAHLDKSVKRFIYKHPFAVMGAALVAGYAGHWILSRPPSSKQS